MNYIGSKHSLLPFLEESVKKVCGEGNDKTLCDIFAGTGAVGKHFKKLGYKIIANDIEYYSYVLNRHYVGNHRKLNFEGLNDDIKGLKKSEKKEELVCHYLNSLSLEEGFISLNYTPLNGNERKYFTIENGKCCDAIRRQIEKWKAERKIAEDEYYYLLASLLESIDKYANTASVYGAYLKKYKRSALKAFHLDPLPLLINEKEHEVYNQDGNELIKKIKADILYLDPPYNSRQYDANYHLLETIAKYDNPSIQGKTGLRTNKIKSKYCSKVTVKQEFKKLILNAKAKYIFLSYNNEGLMSLDDIKEVLSLRGKYGYFIKEYNRYKADKNRDYKSNKTIEYLHYVVVEN